MKEYVVLKWSYSGSMTANPQLKIENPVTMNAVYIKRSSLSESEQIRNFLVSKGFTVVGFCSEPQLIICEKDNSTQPKIKEGKSYREYLGDAFNARLNGMSDL